MSFWIWWLSLKFRPKIWFSSTNFLAFVVFNYILATTCIFKCLLQLVTICEIQTRAILQHNELEFSFLIAQNVLPKVFQYLESLTFPFWWPSVKIVWEYDLKASRWMGKVCWQYSFSYLEVMRSISRPSSAEIYTDSV